ncbi:MAG: hypothetical protein ACTS6A_00340 [Candidatus Hodgkinia cicadicola]
MYVVPRILNSVITFHSSLNCCLTQLILHKFEVTYPAGWLTSTHYASVID